MIVLTPSDHMLVPDFPGLSEDGITTTFDREVALAREDAQFVGTRCCTGRGVRPESSK